MGREASSLPTSILCKKQPTYQVDPIACEGYRVCAKLCPSEAIEFGEVITGEWFLSETRHGPMVHAKVGFAEGNRCVFQNPSMVQREGESLGWKIPYDKKLPKPT